MAPAARCVLSGAARPPGPKGILSPRRPLSLTHPRVVLCGHFLIIACVCISYFQTASMVGYSVNHCVETEKPVETKQKLPVFLVSPVWAAALADDVEPFFGARAVAAASFPNRRGGGAPKHSWKTAKRHDWRRFFCTAVQSLRQLCVGLR